MVSVKRKKKRKNRKTQRYNKAGMIAIVGVVSLMICVLGVKERSLIVRADINRQRIEELEKEREKEIERRKDIDELKKQIESEAFIISRAHDIGLISDNEILFKENK